MALFPQSRPTMQAMPTAPNTSGLLAVGQSNAALEGIKLGNEIANTVRGLEKHKLAVEEAKQLAKALDLELRKRTLELEEASSPEAVAQRAAKAKADAEKVKLDVDDAAFKLGAARTAQEVQDALLREAVVGSLSAPSDGGLIGETVSPDLARLRDPNTPLTAADRARGVQILKNKEANDALARELVLARANARPEGPKTVAVDSVQDGVKYTRWYKVDPNTGAPDIASGPVSETKTGVTDERSNLTQAQSAILQTANELPGIVKSLAEGWQSITTGPVMGRALDLAAKVGVGSEERGKFTAERGAALFKMARALQGAGVLTDRDIARMEPLLPTGNETEGMFRGKVAGIVDMFLTAAEAWKNTYGSKTTPAELQSIDSAITQLKSLDIDSIVGAKPKAAAPDNKSVETVTQNYIKSLMGKTTR